MKKLVLDAKNLPISFKLGDTQYKGMPEGPTAVVDGNNITYTAMIGDVEVKAVCKTYDNFDVSEWTVYFTNKGSEKSPRLSNVNAIEYEFVGENNVIYYGNGDHNDNSGDLYDRDSYATSCAHITTGMFIRQQPEGGRSCDNAFPYHRIMFDGYGYNIAIGWPAQWKCEFRGTDDGILYTAGQATLNSVIYPGETFRTPLILVMSFVGGFDSAVNTWRRWFIANIELPKPYLYKSFWNLEPNEADTFSALNETNSHAKPNVYWLDAGWYDCDTGNKREDGSPDLQWFYICDEWKGEEQRWPKGLRPLSDAVRERGMEFLLWFEPERSSPCKSTLIKTHPEWLIGSLNYDCPWSTIIDFGIPEAREYITKLIGDRIEEYRVDIYREDFNLCPLWIWEERDRRDGCTERFGATENLWNQGLLKFWDDLKARFPHLVFDSCASGGRRNDIEMMKRGVPMHPSDNSYGWHEVQSAFKQTLYEWIPYFRSGVGDSWDEPLVDDGSPFDEFRIVSEYGPMASCIWAQITNNPEYDARAEKYSDMFYYTAPIFIYSDYYALTPYHKSTKKWTAWQFDQPENEKGVIQVIRNRDSEDESLTVLPKMPAGKYLVKNLISGEEFTYEGGEMTFTMPKRSAAIYEYTKI